MGAKLVHITVHVLVISVGVFSTHIDDPTHEPYSLTILATQIDPQLTSD